MASPLALTAPQTSLQMYTGKNCDFSAPRDSARRLRAARPNPARPKRVAHTCRPSLASLQLLR